MQANKLNIIYGIKYLLALLSNLSVSLYRFNADKKINNVSTKDKNRF